MTGRDSVLGVQRKQGHWEKGWSGGLPEGGHRPVLVDEWESAGDWGGVGTMLQDVWNAKALQALVQLK